jgi:hypothetical protein
MVAALISCERLRGGGRPISCERLRTIVSSDQFRALGEHCHRPHRVQLVSDPPPHQSHSAPSSKAATHGVERLAAAACSVVSLRGTALEIPRNRLLLRPVLVVASWAVGGSGVLYLLRLWQERRRDRGTTGIDSRHIRGCGVKIARTLVGPGTAWLLPESRQHFLRAITTLRVVVASDHSQVQSPAPDWCLAAHEASADLDGAASSA